jgi:hypothetical protein
MIMESCGWYEYHTTKVDHTPPECGVVANLTPPPSAFGDATLLVCVRPRIRSYA